MATSMIRFMCTYGRQAHLSRKKSLSFCQNAFRSTQSGVVHEEDFPKRRLEMAQADTLMDIGIRDIFTEEHDIFRTSVRRFFKDEILPNQDRWEKQGHCGKEIWEKMGAAGFLGVNIPAEVGGIGGDFKAAMVIAEEQGYANHSGTSFGMHNDIVMPYIAEYGTPEQLERLIPKMMAGKTVGALAMTEPEAGSDLQGIKTYAKKDGDDWILNGSKVFITNGHSAGVVIVVAITDLDAKKKAHGLSLFLVEEGMPGFNKGKILEKIGLKSFDTTELFFDDVRLPSSALLGGDSYLNKGFYLLMNQLPRERLLLSVEVQSHAEYMFEITRDYVRKRKAFGKALSKLQTIQHRLATLKTELCVTRAFLDRCVQLQDEGRCDSTMASMCKYWTTDLACKMANEGVQLHGGWGYMWEFPIARAFVDSRVYPIYAGSNEIMRELIARDIVKDP